jgi:hypothetical protein
MIRVVHPGSPIPDPEFLLIPDPGNGGQKGTGSRTRIRIRNTAKLSLVQVSPVLYIPCPILCTLLLLTYLKISY